MYLEFKLKELFIKVFVLSFYKRLNDKSEKKYYTSIKE
jgi:hypothetical protein